VHDVRAEDLYGWRLVAAVQSEDDPLVQRSIASEARFVDVHELAGRELATAPLRHRSRDLVDLFADVDPPFRTTAESDDADLLVALAVTSKRVAVIPTDSVEHLEPYWPLLVAKGHGALGGKYRAMWRASGDPKRLASLLQDLANAFLIETERRREVMPGLLEPTPTEKKLRQENA
jgi:hypothetical protein